MKVRENGRVIELTRRNLTILLAKLDDPLSVRTIMKDGVVIVAVEDEAHYTDRPAGEMYMPSSGEVI